MKIPYFCCIGAELKRYTKDFDFMNQVYLYKVPTDDTIEEVFAQDYFQQVADTVLDDDIVYIYEPTTQVLYTCHFNKQNGHITVEQMANNIPALTPNKILISDEDGKIAAGDLSLEDIVVKISTEKQIMQGGLQTPELETDDLTVNGTAEFDNAPTTNDTTTYQNATTDSLVRKEQVDEVVQDIKTSSLTFIGYVSTTAPSSATYALNKHDLWLNSATMPTSFPFPLANIKEWDGTAWVAYNHDYTPANFDFFRNINDSEGYYWFGGEWVIMSTDMSTTYFQLNPISGKWEIKSNVNLPGAPTTTTPSTDDNSTKIATTEFTGNAITATKQKTISNCITEIPQDIKLELNNGTLTLKAGSKVYKPNGADTFDTITIASDTTLTAPTNGQYLIFVGGSNNYLFAIGTAACVSGSTRSLTQAWMCWYDTTNNVINHYGSSSSTVLDTAALPIALVTVSGGAISSIDQVFNGLGYIGSTVFALPGLKGLIPDGRNADGSLKNTITNDLTTVKTVQVNTTTAKIAMYSSGGLGSQTKNFGLNEPENYNYDSSFLTNALEVARVIVDSNAKITAFTPKTAFHAVDYSGADFVVDFQRPTAANNYTWYRKYKSGWVEQGGIDTTSYVTFPVTMANTNYTVTCAMAIPSSNTGNPTVTYMDKTTSGIRILLRWDGAGTNGERCWQVSGMAA